MAAAIIVAVVLRDVVNVVEDQAVPVKILHSLQEAHIEQHGPVKGLASALKAGKKTERETYRQTGKDRERVTGNAKT